MKQVDLGKDKISKLLLTFAIPCVISMLINSIYNIADQIFVGQGVGILGNGATNVLFPLTVICLGFALLIGNGSAAFLSLNLGEKDIKEAKNGIGDAITILSIVSISLGLLAAKFLPQLINLFGCTPDIYPYALEYGRIIVIGLPFSMIATGLSDVIRADGSPKYSMITTVSGAVINIALDALFVLKFKWEMTGAATATVIGQIISCALAINYLFRMKSIKLELKDLKISKSIFKIFGYGTSSFITQINMVIVMIVMNNLLTKYGASSIYGENIPIAVFGIVMKVTEIFISIIVGIAVGSQPLVGFNYGASNFDRVRKVFKKAIQICAIVGLIATIVVMIFPKQIANIFGSGNEIYQDFAVKCFRICAMMSLLNSFTIASSIFMQALGKPKEAMTLSITRQVVLLVPISIFLAYKFGIIGVLAAEPVADTIAFVLAVLIFTHQYKNLEKTRANKDL